MGPDQFLHPGEEFKSGIHQVDGIDGVPGYRDREVHAINHLFLVECHHGGPAPAPDVVPDAVQVHEIDGGIGIVLVRRAIGEAGTHEREVGVGIVRLGDLLLLAQLGAQVHLVVTVSPPKREQRLEHLHEVAQGLAAVIQLGRELLTEVAGRGVVGVVDRLGILGKSGAGPIRNTIADVDHVHTGFGLDLQRNVSFQGQDSAPCKSWLTRRARHLAAHDIETVSDQSRKPHKNKESRALTGVQTAPEYSPTAAEWKFGGTPRRPSPGPFREWIRHGSDPRTIL